MAMEERHAKKKILGGVQTRSGCPGVPLETRKALLGHAIGDITKSVVTALVA